MCIRDRDYRIHGGNSNPRHREFAAMTASIAPRHEAWRLLLEQDRFPLPEQDRACLLYTSRCV